MSFPLRKPNVVKFCITFRKAQVAGTSRSPPKSLLSSSSWAPSRHHSPACLAVTCDRVPEIQAMGRQAEMRRATARPNL